MICGEKISFTDLATIALSLEKGCVVFSRSEDPDNHIEAIIANPKKNTIRDKTVVESPAENVAE